MNKTIRKIIKKNKAILIKAYRDGYRRACYRRAESGSNRFFSVLMTLIPFNFRKDMSLNESMIFNNSVTRIARQIVDINKC